MNILLWVVQILLAVFCVMGAMWRFTNREQAKNIPSLKALSLGMFYFIGICEIVCGLGLVLPGLLALDPTYTATAALCLAVEQLALTILHAKFFGFKVRAANPAVWTFAFFVFAAFVAYGRAELSPF